MWSLEKLCGPRLTQEMVGFFRCAEGPGGGADSASPVDVVVRWCNAMARVVAMMVDLLLTQGLGYKSSGHEHGSRSHGDKRMAAMVSEECWNSPPPLPPANAQSRLWPSVESLVSPTLAATLSTYPGTHTHGRPKTMVYYYLQTVLSQIL